MRVLVYEYLSAHGEGGSSLLAEGRAMLRAALTDLAGCPGGVLPVTVVAPHLLGETRAALSLLELEAHPNHEDEQSLFRELARGCRFALVIAPEFDDLLAARCEWAVQEGCTLLGPSPEIVRLTADKLALAAHLAAHGVPTPPTALCLGHPGPFPCPVVLKPRRGAGSQNTHGHDSPQGVARALRDAPAGWEGELIVQPLLAGRAASVAVIAGEDGRLTVLPPCQQLFEPGTFRYLGGRAPLPEGPAVRAAELARRVVAALPGLRGYCGIDLVLADHNTGGPDAVVEINPRLTTSYVGLRRLCQGGNLMHHLLAAVAGEPAPPLSWGDGPVSFQADGQTTLLP